MSTYCRWDSVVPRGQTGVVHPVRGVSSSWVERVWYAAWGDGARYALSLAASGRG